MKPLETQLISEISELQSMVLELKSGFSGALLELSHIQQEDARLREDLERTRQHCDREALQLRTLVESLKMDLDEVRNQICQLHKDQRKPWQADGGRVVGSTQTLRNSCARQAGGGSQIDSQAPPLSQPASLLLHCYLQGLRAGLSPGTETPVTSQAPSRLAGASHVPVIPCNTKLLQDSKSEDQRQQVVLELFHSEQEYLSTLFQLCDKYKMPSALPTNHGTCQRFVTYLEQLSQHSLLFRNALEARLLSGHWPGLVGDVFARLMCQDEGTFMGIYLGYVRMLPMVLSHFHQSNGTTCSPQWDEQDGPQEREALRISRLLAPVTRIHSYLAHVQELLQWTGRDHPDHYSLQVSTRALRNLLNQCHMILEQGGLQGDREEAPCSSPAPPVGTLSPSCQHKSGSKALTLSEPGGVKNSEPDKDSGFPAWSHPGSHCTNLQGSVRRGCGQGGAPNPTPPPLLRPGFGCHGDRSLPWGAADPGGEETGSSPAWAPPPPGAPAWGPGAHCTRESFEDCDTDPEDLGDASVFDYSSVKSCSPDGALEIRERQAAEEDEEEEEEDSQVPVLLKPAGVGAQPAQRFALGVGSVCLGARVPSAPPRPPPGKPWTAYADHPGTGSSQWIGVSASPNPAPPQPSPPHPFRPVCKASSEQREITLREHKVAHGTRANPRRLDRGGLRSVRGMAFGRARRSSPQVTGDTGAWEDSEDSDGPCSTV